MFPSFGPHTHHAHPQTHRTLEAKGIPQSLMGSLAFATFSGFVLLSTVSTTMAQSTVTAQSVQSAPPMESTLGRTMPFEGVAWQLAEWRVNGRNISLLPQRPITLQFDGNRLGGSTGCNSYGSDYRVRNSRLQLLGDIISTQIGCAPAVAEREQRYVAALSSPRLTIRPTQNRLTLRYTTDSGQGVLVFTPAQSKLQNTTWQLNSITTNSTTVVTMQPPATVQFTANSVSGFSGCNQYNASYQSNTGHSQEQNPLKIRAIASTKKACANPRMQFEQEFLARLATVQRYEINQAGNLRLFFQERNRSGILTFTPSQRIPQN